MRTLLLACLFTAQIPAHAFIFIRGSAYQKGERPVSNAPVWEQRTVNFLINTNQTVYGGTITPGISSTQFLDAVTSSVNAWAAACNADVRVKLLGTSTSVKNAGDQVNTITWDNRTTAQGNFFSDNSILAAAYTTLASDSFYDCDIVVNGEFSGTFGVSGESNKYDLISTLTHEIGHCLGLDHPVEPPNYTSSNSNLYRSTMVQTAVAGIGSIFRRDIHRDDADGLTCMYERGRQLRNGAGCESYHGTNGNGVISGNLPSSRGAQTDQMQGCGTVSSAVTVQSNPDETGGGCVNEAFASGEIRKPARMNSFSLIFLALFISFFAHVIFRRKQTE